MIVGEAAKRTGLPVKTVRYYEEIGLVIPDRRGNGYRDYSQRHIHNLCFIQRTRSLGFSIEDCRSLLSLYENKTRKSADVKEIAQKHLAMIEEKVTRLRTMHTSLNHLVEECKGDHLPDCPILNSLAGTRK